MGQHHVATGFGEIDLAQRVDLQAPASVYQQAGGGALALAGEHATAQAAAFGLQFGHGLGLALHERPIISRVVSLEHPMEIKTGMVFALETYCPAKDGFSAARIEEEVVLTPTGAKVISLYPAQELPVANAY